MKRIIFIIIGPETMGLKKRKADFCSENVNSATKIFDEYGDFIYSVIRYKVKDEASAEDLYQDFFLSLVSSPIRKEVKDMKSYLYRAIINKIFDTKRQAIAVWLHNKKADGFRLAHNGEERHDLFYTHRQADAQGDRGSGRPGRH